jgi:hypothetical protein
MPGTFPMAPSQCRGIARGRADAQRLCADREEVYGDKGMEASSGFAGDGVFVEDEDAVRLQVEISGNGCAREKIVHWLVKLDPEWRALMVEEEEDVGIVSMAHADFDLIGHFEQGMNIAHLPKPGDEIGIKMLMALGADVDGFAKPECMHRHRRTACVKVFGVRGEDLAVLGLDDVAPQSGWMQVSGRESAFEGEMVFFAGRKLIEFGDFEAEKIGEVVGIAGIGGHVVFVHETGVESGDECAAILNVELEAISFPARNKMK